MRDPNHWTNRLFRYLLGNRLYRVSVFFSILTFSLIAYGQPHWMVYVAVSIIVAERFLVQGIYWIEKFMFKSMTQAMQEQIKDQLQRSLGMQPFDGENDPFGGDELFGDDGFGI